VKVLLQLNPYYKVNWQKDIPAGVSDAERDRMLFMVAATWPDQIKFDSTYKSDGTDNGNTPPTDGTATRNTGYSDKARHKYWHFIDEPFSQDGTSLPAVPGANAEERIGLFRKVLASNAKDTLKSYDLVWLLHLVGDVHQPLHCSTRVTSAEHQGDSGGNDVVLACPPCPTGHCSPCSKELHAFWDGAAGGNRNLEDTISAANSLPAPDATLAAKSDEKDWVKESFDEAQQAVYVAPVGPGLGPFTLDGAYRSAARTLARKRVALGGARLAHLLNDELK
jgi:hypothetical protein